MEGEILASGTHEELMNTSPEYAQIFDSQKSTNSMNPSMNYKLNKRG